MISNPPGTVEQELRYLEKTRGISEYVVRKDSKESDEDRKYWQVPSPHLINCLRHFLVLGDHRPKDC